MNNIDNGLAQMNGALQVGDNNLRVQRHRNAPINIPVEDDCPICLEAPRRGLPFILIHPGTHRVCVPCFLMLVARRGVCPICRAQIATNPNAVTDVIHRNRLTLVVDDAEVNARRFTLRPYPELTTLRLRQMLGLQLDHFDRGVFRVEMNPEAQPFLPNPLPHQQVVLPPPVVEQPNVVAPVLEVHNEQPQPVPLQVPLVQQNDPVNLFEANGRAVVIEVPIFYKLPNSTDYGPVARSVGYSLTGALLPFNGTIINGLSHLLIGSFVPHVALPVYVVPILMDVCLGLGAYNALSYLNFNSIFQRCRSIIEPTQDLPRQFPIGLYNGLHGINPIMLATEGLIPISNGVIADDTMFHQLGYTHYRLVGIYPDLYDIVLTRRIGMVLNRSSHQVLVGEVFHERGPTHGDEGVCVNTAAYLLWRITVSQLGLQFSNISQAQGGIPRINF